MCGIMQRQQERRGEKVMEEKTVKERKKGKEGERERERMRQNGGRAKRGEK